MRGCECRKIRLKVPTVKKRWPVTAVIQIIKRDHDKEIVWSEVDKLVKDLRKTEFLQKFRL